MGRDKASPIAPTIAHRANIQYAPEADQIKCRSHQLRSIRHCKVKWRRTHPKGGRGIAEAIR
ncbi:hypothetical protein [Microcoleus sp. D3_18a_C4]|uniref:hypothetical protein n=1 Tax=unclassified Microcoleus TaxID=2642155 RepID=UPI002FD716BD